MELYYHEPFQVAYIKMDASGEYATGIAYHDYIIDIQTGAAYTTRDVVINADALKIEIDDAVVEWSDWAPLSFLPKGD